jgi:hypothetical protein
MMLLLAAPAPQHSKKHNHHDRIGFLTAVLLLFPKNEAAPAPGVNFVAAPAPAASAPTLLYSKAKFLKRTQV